MAGGAATHTANKNRAVRQEALREQLSKQKHLEHVIDLLGEISELELEQHDEGSWPVTKFEMDKRLAVVDRKLKLINKYLPDLKQQDITLGGDPDSPLAVVKADMTPEQAHETYLKMLEGE